MFTAEITVCSRGRAVCVPQLYTGRVMSMEKAEQSRPYCSCCPRRACAALAAPDGRELVAAAPG